MKGIENLTKHRVMGNIHTAMELNIKVIGLLIKNKVSELKLGLMEQAMKGII